MERLWTAFVEQDASKAPEGMQSWLGDLFESQARFRADLATALNDTERQALRKKYATRLLATVSPSLIETVATAFLPPIQPAPGERESLDERMRDVAEWINDPTDFEPDEDPLCTCLRSLPSVASRKRVAHVYFSEQINARTLQGSPDSMTVSRRLTASS
jgi:hypothetical protein